jgi:hypothetical protein
MKSPPKLPLEEQSRPALDKEPLSLLSPIKQAEIDLADANQGHKTGDVKGHGGSVSASLGLSSLVSLDILDRQTAADTIRNGSLLFLSQHTEATGNNSDASPQVETSFDVPREKVKRTPEEDILRREAYALRSKDHQKSLDKLLGGDSLSPKSQAWRTKRLAMAERDLADAKRFREQAQERLLAPPCNNFIGQHVLGVSFCINRLEEIRQCQKTRSGDL